MACWCTLHDFTPLLHWKLWALILLPVMAPCNYDQSDVIFMTDLMYFSSTTSICHIGEKVIKSMTNLMYLSSTTSICRIGEKVVKSTTYLMYLSHSTSICCICLLVIKITSSVHLGIRYSKKSHLLQQKYLQCSISHSITHTALHTFSRKDLYTMVTHSILSQTSSSN